MVNVGATTIATDDKNIVILFFNFKTSTTNTVAIDIIKMLAIPVILGIAKLFTSLSAKNIPHLPILNSQALGIEYVN